ncbi:uncharacterized protein SPPG_03160 [Spizellomyces punctatus DAOM BR117]|uniref:Gem-associated protein 2 n=1 Tax=Spizellomyces punctatus (strain DAOM BR117) TaxID=645134 RepID=A0A0L0HJY5_SPIPD|nr:uncharacterized protein SPPG_03160 [Spizellomyces punctatus DAOM BR117]KND01348.1 hypothetical protein SPPG_03160 [Spizellomyces punctatus DAOM BR117]|eukprot:XP_016609387.1 hypothetical protein SPPG_03160 [Spizellomyces punctatus DAOM BR117]
MNYRRGKQKSWTQSDEDSIRRPALPLEGYDEDEPLLAPGAPPASGLQYLRMVRAEANACQQVVTVSLPAEKLHSPIPPNVFDVRKEYFGTKASGDESYIPENLRPSADWLNNFLERFNALHDEVAKRRQIVRKSVSSRFFRPNLYNERGWKRFCYGDPIENAPQEPSANMELPPNAPVHEPSVSEDVPESVPELTPENVVEIQEHEDAKDPSDSDILKKRKRELDEEEGDTSQKSKRLQTQSAEPTHDEQAKKLPPSGKQASETDIVIGGKEPLLNLICNLEQGEVLKVLKYHTNWLSDDDISEEQCQWIFALLLRLDTLLHGDEVSIIRDLCRKCRGIRSHMIDLDAGDPRAATLNMIVAIVSHIFGQRDLGDQVS